MIKTVVGSFDTADEAQRASRELRQAGFLESDINVVINNIQRSEDESSATDTRTGAAAKGAVAGGVLGGAAAVAASLAGLAIPGIGPILAAGPIVAALAGAGAGAVAGGLIGALTEAGVDKNEAELYAESVRRGGSLVYLRTDETRAEEAARFLRAAGAVDINQRAEEWRSSGWTGYDQTAKPLTYDEIQQERERFRASENAALDDNLMVTQQEARDGTRTRTTTSR